MKILIIDNSVGVTGAIKAILETIENLREHQFYFLIPTGSETRTLIESKGYEVSELNFIEISRNQGKNLLYPFRLLGNAYKISRMVKRRQIQVIQVNDIYNLTGIFTKLFTRVKVIVHIRRMPESFPGALYRLWVKIVSRRADVILPVSKANAIAFGENRKVHVLYDPAILDQRSFVYPQNTSEELKVLYLANYTRGKGQNYAIEVMNSLQKMDLNGIALKLKFVGSDFNLAGNKLFKEELQQLSEHYRLAKLIDFEGESKNVFEEISQCDIMLNFSDSESLSRVTMEALYYGIPIVATNVGGTNEMITHDFNGLLVERADVAQMTEALYTLLVSKEKRLLFNRNNAGLIADKFSAAKITHELNTIYKAL